MDDNSIMPFGKHMGEKMANIPPEYLLYLYESCNIYGEVKKYIEENLDVIKLEIKRKQKE